MNKKLSVIVPVYNTLQFLPACLTSIQQQKYEPMEVILVDDGSPDDSGKFCDEFASKDPRFQVIHKPNGGISSARNAGIEAATGDYITFIDSDDILVGQPYQHLLENTEEDVDIFCMARYASREIHHDVSHLNDRTVTEKLLQNEEIYSGLCDRTLSDAVWDKIFKRELFEELRFDQGVLNEDFLLMLKLLMKYPVTMKCSDYVGYYYYLRQGSITGSGFKQNMIDSLYNAEFAYANAPEACKTSALSYFLHRILMFLVNMPATYIAENNRDYAFAMEHLRRQRKSIGGTKLSLRDKTLLNLYCVAPGFAKGCSDLYLGKKKQQ